MKFFLTHTTLRWTRKNYYGNARYSLTLQNKQNSISPDGRVAKTLARQELCSGVVSSNPQIGGRL